MFSRSEGSKARRPARGPLACSLRAAAVGAAITTSLFAVIMQPPSTSIEGYVRALDSAEHVPATDALVDRTKALVDELVRDAPAARLNGTIDVVVSGGGFRGQYAGGVLSVLAELRSRGLLRVERWAGASIGACVAATFALEGYASVAEFFRVPYGWQAAWRAEEFWKGAPLVRAMIERGMPPNAHEILSGKLHVSITCFNPSPRAILVSNFSTRQSLIDALAASAAMPGLSGEPILTKYDGRFCVDGGIALNTPTFWDNKRDQLVINLGALTYPLLSTFYPLDKNHLELVRAGQDDAIKFLRGEEVESLQVVVGQDVEFSKYRRSWRALARQRYRFDVKPWAFIGFRELFLGFGILLLVLFAALLGVVLWQRVVRPPLGVVSA